MAVHTLYLLVLSYTVVPLGNPEMTLNVKLLHPRDLLPSPPRTLFASQVSREGFGIFLSAAMTGIRPSLHSTVLQEGIKMA